MLRKLLILLLLGLIQGLRAQHRASDPESRVHNIVVFPLSLSDTVVVLPHRFLVQGSARAMLDSAKALLADRDFVFSPVKGTVSIRKELIESLLADSVRHSLSVFRSERFVDEEKEFQSCSRNS